MEQLPPRQRKVLAFVTLKIAEGRPPTLQEIADHLGINSSTAVRDHLLALQKKGHVEILRGARGIRVIKTRRSGS